MDEKRTIRQTWRGEGRNCNNIEYPKRRKRVIEKTTYT